MTALINGGRVLFAVRNPDVLYFRGTPEELPTFTLPRIEPIAAAGRRPGPFHVRGGGELDRLHAGGVPEVPHPIHVVVLGEHFREGILCPRDHVDHPARDIGGLERRVELGRRERGRLGGHYNYRVAEGDRRCHQRYETEQRKIVRGGDTEHAHRLVHRERDAADRGVVHRAVPLVGPGRVREQPRDAGIHFFLSHASREFGGARREVFGDEVENLRTQMTAGAFPSFGGVRCLDRIAYVLAIALAHLAQDATVRSEDLARVALIRARLLAADEELVGAIYRWEQGGGSRERWLAGSDCCACTLLPAPCSLLPRRLQVLVHTFPSTFSTEPRLAVASEPRRRVEQIRAVDPHDAGLQLGRDIECEVDVLRPDARREAIGGVIRKLHGLLRRAERHAHQHRTEDLDLRDRGGRRHVGEQRRRIEVAFGRTCPGRLPHLRAFLDSLLHQPADALELHRRDDGAHVAPVQLERIRG